MTQEEMQAAVDGLAKLMGEKGFRMATATVSIEANASGGLLLRWAKEDERWHGEAKYFPAGSIQERIAAAEAWIAAHPSPEERALREFQAALGRVIDLGRANGIDVAFINPLAETAKALAENAITDQRGVVA